MKKILLALSILFINLINASTINVYNATQANLILRIKDGEKLIFEKLINSETSQARQSQV